MPNELKPIKDMPPIISSWRGHTDAVISIDFVEHKELIITASLDCCVSLWTLCGRYIGKLAHFLKGHNSKILSRNQLKFST